MRRNMNRVLHYIANAGMILFATAALAGCAQMKDEMRGQAFGVSATVAGFTVSVGGTVPFGGAP